MKFLYNPSRDSQTDWKNGYLFVEGKVEEDTVQGDKQVDEKEKKTERKETDKNIDAILNNPLSFSMRHIKQLEEEIQGFDVVQMRKFRNLVEYYLTLASEDVNGGAARTLLKIYQSANLKKNIQPTVQETIEKISSDQMERFQKIVNKKTTFWSERETLQVSVLYRLYKTDSDSSKFEELLKTAKTKLVEKRDEFLDRLEVAEVEGQVKEVIEEGNSQRALTQEEKLLLLEIEKVFPNDLGDWAGKEKEYEHWKRVKKEVLEKAFRDVEKELQKPQNYLLWDILQDGDISPEREEEIESITLRQNAAQFLVFAKEQEVLLKTHWDILKKIEKDPKGEFTPKSFPLEGETTLENKKELDEILKQKEELEQKKKELEAAIEKEEEKKVESESELELESVESSASKVEVEKLNTEIYNLQQKENALGKEEDDFRKYKEMYEDPKKQSEVISDAFVKKLEERIQSHQIATADLDVLWEIQNDGESKQKFTKELPPQYNELREKMEEVLFEPGGHLDQILGELKEDSLSEWIGILNEKLSNVTLKSKLKEKGFNITEAFKAQSEGDIGMDITTLLEGSKLHFRDRIKERLEKSILNMQKENEKEKAKEILEAYWNKMTVDVASKKDIDTLQGNQSWYLATKELTTIIVDKERAECDSIIEDKQNTRLHKDEKGKQEKELLKDSFDESEKQVRRGKIVEDEKYGKVFVPGRDDLAEISIKTQQNQERIKKTTQILKQKLGDLQKNLETFHRTEELKRRNLSFDQETLGADLKQIIDSWPGEKGELNQNIAEQKSLCLEHAENHPHKEDFINLFVNEHFGRIDETVSQTDDLFSELKSEAERTNYQLDGSKDYFSEIGEQLGLIYNFCNFRDGLMAEQSAQIKEDVKLNKKVLDFLKEEQLFKNRDEFKTRFRNLRGEYNSKFQQYRNNINAVDRIMQKDLGMKEGDFIAKYGIDKNAARAIVQDHFLQQDDFEKAWNEFTDGKSGTSFEDDWFDSYEQAVTQDDSVKLNEVLDQLKGIENMTAVVKIAETDSGALADFLREYQEKTKKKGLFGNFQFNKGEFSLYDLYRVVKESFDAANKHWKRNSDRNVADVGKAFWGENNRFGREFARMQEESESARFKEFETQYHDRPGWEILEAIKTSKNEDMVRGCINLLSEKGFLKWDDPILWRAFNRLQKTVQFNIPEDFDLTPHQILEKVKTACEIIWTPEVFRQWDTGLDGNLKKAKENFDGEFAKYENDDKPRTAILAGMLQRWSQGDVEDVDPARYEHFLFAAFRDGKMNGQPDQRWYFMIQGISTRNPRTGQTLLSKDVMMRINKEFLQRFPFVDFLADKESPKLNGRIVPKGTPGAHTLWEEADYQCWADMLGTGSGSFNPTKPPARARTESFFYQIINESVTCKQRVQRMGRFAQAPDHDDGVNYQFAWDHNRVVENINLESSGLSKMSEDFWRSWLSGFDKYVMNKKAMIDHGDMEWKGQEFWDGEHGDRKRHLKEIGKSVKVALSVTQFLQGNKTTDRGTTTFDNDEWEKASNYSVPAEPNRQKINGFAKSLLAEGGEEGAYYEEIFDFQSRQKFGVTRNDREKGTHQDAWKAINTKVSKLLDTDESEQKYFKDTTLIEKALETYCSGKSVPDYLIT